MSTTNVVFTDVATHTTTSLVSTTVSSDQSYGVVSVAHGVDYNTSSVVDMCSGQNWTEPEKVIWQPHVIQRVTTLAVVMVLALTGNTTIILLLTCTRYWKRHSRVNIFIIHLAIGDLTVCFCTMTTEIIFVAFDQWVLGAALCKILPYLQLITLASTTFILTSMSFDRYLAICKPLTYRATTANAKRFIAVSWILAFVLCIPQLLIFVQTEEKRGCRTYYYCKSKGYTALWQRMLYFSFTTVYILVIPVVLISFFYISIVNVVSKASQVLQDETNNLRRPSTASGKATFPRAKIKTLKMTFAIIASFVVCWTPYFVTTLVRIYSNYKIHIPDSVMAFVETIAFVQSFLNPLLYGFFNIKVKRGFREFVCSNRGKNMRRSPSYNERSPGLLNSVSSGGIKGRTRHNYEMKICGKSHLQDLNLNNHSISSSGTSQERSVRGSSVALTEANINGVKLRVRFASKEQCNYFSTEGLNYCRSELMSPCDLLKLPPSTNAQTQLYRPHSQQHLYRQFK